MLKTLIVDDEAPARARLRRLLRPFEKAGRLEIVAEAADGDEALERLLEGGIDLLLLDIQMPGPSGFDVLDRLPPERRPVVVFTTAHDAYALQAFEASAVDYLLKPIEGERLAAALERAERMAGAERPAHEERLGELLEYLDRQALRPPPEARREDFLRRVSIPAADRHHIVPVERLVSAEIEEGITRLYILHEAAGAPRLSRHIVPHTLEGLERRLDPEAFLRVHRSALVQIAHIREVIPWFSGRFKLVLSGGHEVIASRARSRELRERLSL